MDYLKRKYDFNDRDIVNTYDELPLWAAPFGMKLLDKIPYRRNMKVLDVGSGAGFPVLEVAQRLGNTSKVYGLDLWERALEHIRYKSQIYNVSNIECVMGDANDMPFGDEEFDLIISNNGINNTGNEQRTMDECYRVCKRNGTLIFTVNLPETMMEFYEIYEKLLENRGMKANIVKMKEHINKHRKSVEELKGYVINAGFKVEEEDVDRFHMRFADGSSMLNYHFISMCFLPRWVEVVGKEAAKDIFRELEIQLNEYANVHGGLSLTIPYVCFKCSK